MVWDNFSLLMTNASPWRMPRHEVCDQFCLFRICFSIYLLKFIKYVIRYTLNIRGCRTKSKSPTFVPKLSRIRFHIGRWIVLSTPSFFSNVKFFNLLISKKYIFVVLRDFELLRQNFHHLLSKCPHLKLSLHKHASVF